MSCCGCTPRPIGQLFAYSMKKVAFASSQGLALIGFFPCAILFSQSQINDHKVLIDPQMFLFIKKKDFMALFMGGVQLPLGQNHFEEAVYFLPLSSQKLLVLIFYQPRKDKQHKYQNLIQRKRYRSLSSQNVISPGRLRFLAILVSDTKILC